MAARSLSLVLPAYNEVTRIGPTLDEIFGYVRRRGEQDRYRSTGAAELPTEFRVLVVDDRSTDETAERS